LATVFRGRVQAPARIYADANLKIGIFLGDFVPELQAAHAIARAMLRWAKEKECSLIVTSTGLPLQEEEQEHELSSAASDAKAREVLRAAKIPISDLTAVGGTAGRLLLEGRDQGIPVVALIVKTHRDTEDFEAGLKLAEAVGRIVPNAQCDLASLREEAKQREKELRRIQSQTAAPGIYR
jgi:predicted ATP-grasp superfamily ATP-dependent carboligase